MSNRTFNILISLTTLFMVILAFAGGYLTNDYLTLRAEEKQAVSANPATLSLFNEAWDKIETNYLGDLPNETQINYGAIRGSFKEINDPYTIFLEPIVREQEKVRLRGNFGGIGAEISRDDQDNVRLNPLPNNPAQKAGIQADDILIAVDGRQLSTESTQEIADLIKGEKGTTVTLTVIHPNETDPTDIDVTRDDILVPSVSYRLLRDAPTIGYIKISRMSGETAGEVASAITDLQAQNAQQYILDLRGNGGGLLNTAIEVADHFLADAVVFHQTSRAEGETSERTSTDTLLPSKPIAMLIDGGTASSAEIVAGALQDHNRATLIGETTFGKGSVQLVYDLSDTSSVHVTSARWLTPNRNEIDQNGLTPDIGFGNSPEAVAEGRDPQLTRAIEYLQTGQ